MLQYNHEDFAVLAAKVLSGNASVQEEGQLKELVTTEPEAKKQFESLKMAWELSVPAALEREDLAVDTSAAWQKVQAKMHRAKTGEAPLIPLASADISSYAKPETPVISISQGTKHKTSGGSADAPVRSISFSVWAIAASLVLAVSAGIWVFMQQNKPMPDKGPTIALAADNKSKEAVYPDGSKMTMAAGAELSYQYDPTNTQRRVRLSKGACYFQVEKNPEKPFVVNTALGDVRVLGTKFVVSLLGTDSARVEVQEGRVSVKANAGEASGIDTALLTAGQALIITPSGLRRIEFEAENMVWATKNLKFSSTPLSDAVEQIEKVYGVKVKLENPASGRCLLTAIFSNRSLPEVLEIIEGTLNIKAEKEGENYVLKGEGC
ncbi:MAG: FecR domain-containing protein [Bacteroidota bacterium]